MHKATKGKCYWHLSTGGQCCKPCNREYYKDDDGVTRWRYGTFCREHLIKAREQVLKVMDDEDSEELRDE